MQDNQNPLHRAGEEQEEVVALLLLEHGADANTLDIKNRTPLHHLSKLGRVGAGHVVPAHGVNAKA